jgi:hypothetical protein
VSSAGAGPKRRRAPSGTVESMRGRKKEGGERMVTVVCASYRTSGGSPHDF